MKTSSCKAKGRRAAQEVKDLLLSYCLDLESGDITVTPSGVPGVDLHLSPKAKLIYPFCIECKNQESLQIWKALEQAQSHKKHELECPVLFFKRNHSNLYVALNANDFIKLMR